MESIVTAKAQHLTPDRSRVSVRIEIPGVGGITITDILIRSIGEKSSVTMPLRQLDGSNHPCVMLRGDLKRRVFEAAISASKQIQP